MREEWGHPKGTNVNSKGWNRVAPVPVKDELVSRVLAWKENNMPLISLIVVLVVVGVILWVINNYIPMDRKIKSILNIVVVIIVILWLLSVFGVIGSLSGLRVGK
jgi:hypothetical protein